MKINIRDAEPTDARAIATIHVKTWQYAYKGQIPDSYLKALSIKERTQGWQKQITKPDKGVHTLVLTIDRKIVGWCTAGASRDDDAQSQIGEIYGIYIHPDYIGKKLGTRLITHALNILKEEGYKKATLWVLKTNKKTRKWYKKNGFKPDGKKKTEKKGSVELSEVRYVKNLEQHAIHLQWMKLRKCLKQSLMANLRSKKSCYL